MKTYTLDNIVRNALSEKGYTMHWYLQFLQYGIDAFREMNFDVLQNVKSVRLPLSSYKAVILPCDFVAILRLGTELGQYIDPLIEKKDSFNRLNKFDGSGNKIPYSEIQFAAGAIPSNYDGFWYGNYTNDKAEHLGRMFNNRPSFRNSYVLLRERNEIQLDSSVTFSEVVLDYISDGVTSDATTAVHPYAMDAIKKYIFWRHKENGRQYNLSERAVAKEEYYNALRILRARMNEIDIENIRRSLAGAYSGSIKN